MFHRLFRSRKHGRPATLFTPPTRWNKSFLQLERLDDRIVPAFNAAVNYAAGTDPQAVVTADLNNDSLLDIAVANTGSGTVSVLLGNADGTFQAAISSSAGNQPTSLAVGDFNGDGNLDLAITSLFWEGGGRDGSYVGVLLGTGAGTFTTLPEWPSEGGWSQLGGTEFLPDSVVADFNGDGKLDIAAPSYHGYLPVALGNGDGTFRGQSVFSGVTEGSSIVAADFNADGKVDLAVAGDSSVGVLLGNGNGYFGTTQTYNAGSGSLSDLAVADFNGDGLLDAVTSDADTGTISELLGSGNGALTYAGAYAVGLTPSAIAVGDFNGDGRPDAATANAGSNAVSVLLNDGDWTPPPPSPPALQIGDRTLTEGNTGAASATFTVTLSAASTETITVVYATADASATAGRDYNATSGTLTFAPGETSKTITVPVNGDVLVEDDEMFAVNLSNAVGATILDGQGTGTIVNDDVPPRPTISISDVTRAEGRKGQKTLFTFTVTLSAASTEPVTISYRTVNGTATTGDKDYVAKSGTITFAPGETEKTITIEVKGDNRREADEIFYLDLYDDSGASLFAKSRGVGTIVNDD